MWIERDFSVKVKGAAQHYPVVVLTGARQTGKTSLLKKLFPQYSFVTLDLPSQADLAEKNPEEFIKKFPPPVIVDEVQYAPKFFRHLKYWVDQNRSKKGQFLLTGSQKFTLMKSVGDSLAGRCALLEMGTLSLPEIQRVHQKMSEIQILLRGGYPEVQSNPDMDTDLFYQSYLATYIERDVRSLLNVVQLRDFERFIRLCALRCGQILNKSDLARDVGISATTANQWMSVLEASNQVSLLEPWHTNRSKSLIKSPKIYFNDTGMLCHLLGISTVEELIKSPFAGALWENFVYSELKKFRILKRNSSEIYFWRDLRGLEIDFLIHTGGKYHLLEAKLSEHPDMKDTKNLEKVAMELGQNHVSQQDVVCRTSLTHPLSNNIRAVSLESLVTS